MPIHGPSAQSSAIGNLLRLRATQGMMRGFRFAGLKFQLWTLYIENVSGTIKHYFAYTLLELRSQNINPQSLFRNSTYSNTPTVSPSVGFGNVGVGILSGAVHKLLIDMPNPQDPDRYLGVCSIKIYDGANVLPRVTAGIESNNVLGDSKPRLTLGLFNDMTGAAALTSWTTFIPSTRRVGIMWMGFLR